MKISKAEAKYSGQIILIWTFINLIFNAFGLLITKLLDKAGYSPMESIINEFIKPLSIQTLLFGLCLTLGFIFLKNKKIAFYTFAIFQVVVFHLIFFLNLKIHPAIHFESTFSNVGMVYLSYSGQYLIDILYLYFPINGNFENGAFMPGNIGTFYLHWILLNLVYYFVITWISIKIVNLIIQHKAALKLSRKLRIRTRQNSDTETL